MTIKAFMCIQEVFVPQLLTDWFIFPDEETEAQRVALLESRTKWQQQSQDLNSGSLCPWKTVYFLTCTAS